MEEEKLKIIKEEAQKLLKFLRIEASFEIQEDEEKGVLNLSLKTEDSGLLIGYHGQTLSSLELIFNLAVYKKTGQWIKILFNVGDWRERREEYLEKMAANITQRVEATGEAIVCPYLTASERRIIHLALKDNPRVATESEGEGENRRLVIKPKT